MDTASSRMNNTPADRPPGHRFSLPTGYSSTETVALAKTIFQHDPGDLNIETAPIVNWSLTSRFSVALWTAIGIILMTGCDFNQTPDDQESTALHVALPALAALGEDIQSAVVAQGQLEPAKGIVPIVAPVGDRIISLQVAEGDIVTQGQIVGELQSLQARQTELAVSEIKLAEARATAAAQRSVAEAKLSVADVGLRQAELKLSQAKAEFRRAEEPGGQLSLLNESVELAQNKLEQLRRASQDPTAGRLVSSTSLDQQQLEVKRSRSQWESAREAARQEIDLGTLSVEAAKKDLNAARLSIDSAEAATPFASLERQIDLLKLQVSLTQLISPISGVVLSVDAIAGEPTTGMPLMHVADLSQMVCRVEVNVADIPRLSVGAIAKISSPSFTKPLSGKIQSISRMIGSPQLASPYPMAQTDYRSAEVVVMIDPEDSMAAAGLINLQVDVAFAANRTAE